VPLIERSKGQQKPKSHGHSQSNRKATKNK
jgi:hypothetical protein